MSAVSVNADTDTKAGAVKSDHDEHDHGAGVLAVFGIVGMVGVVAYAAVVISRNGTGQRGDDNKFGMESTTPPMPYTSTDTDHNTNTGMDTETNTVYLRSSTEDYIATL